MIQLYAWPTPHGMKVTIMLEELQLPYQLTLIDPTKPSEQEPSYAKLLPQGQLPYLIDSVKGNPIHLWDSGAILLYLAEKNKQFVPQELIDRARVYQWFMHQSSVLTSILGHVYYYRKLILEKNQEAINRYTNEAIRLLQALELHLKDNPYLAGDYSIADIAIFPWIMALEQLELNIDQLEHLSRWRDTISHRPAVEKGIEIFKAKMAA